MKLLEYRKESGKGEGMPMLSNAYYESVTFNGNNNFNISKRVDAEYIGRLHWHPFIEILVSLSDGNEISINFTNYTLNMNDVAVIYPGDLHSIVKENTGSLWVIQFSKELLDIINEMKNSIPLFQQFRIWRYEPSSMESDYRLMLLKSFFEAGNDTEYPFHEVRMYSLLLTFFEKLGAYCVAMKIENDSSDSDQGVNKTHLMAEACLFISQNCTKPLTLDETAVHMGISKSHFSHLFKKYTGLTFVDFLTEERIKRAKSFFGDKDISITEIAFESGFSSISSFNRAFKKITGLSPSHFRESMVSSVNK